MPLGSVEQFAGTQYLTSARGHQSREFAGSDVPRRVGEPTTTPIPPIPRIPPTTTVPPRIELISPAVGGKKRKVISFDIPEIPKDSKSNTAVFELSTVDGKTKLIPIDKEQGRTEPASSESKTESNTAGSVRQKGSTTEKGLNSQHNSARDLLSALRGVDPRLVPTQNSPQSPLSGLMSPGPQNPLQNPLQHQLQGAFPQLGQGALNGMVPGVGQNAFSGNLHSLGQNPHALGQNMHGLGQNPFGGLGINQNPFQFGAGLPLGI